MRRPVRSLVNSPGFTLVALLTLALGIGVNTSVFSVIDTLLFRTGPFPQPDQLYQIAADTPQGRQMVFSEPELREIKPHTGSFRSLTTISRPFFALSDPGQPAERVSGIVATADLFTTFGVQPMLGRAFTAAETAPGRNDVVVISYTFWQQRFGGAQDVIGRTLRLDGQPVTIIGVMPASFEYRMLWGNAVLWRPLNFTKDQQEWRDYRAFSLVGRLALDSSAARVAAELAPVAAQQQKEHPQSYSSLRYRAVPLRDALMDDLGRKILWMLLGLAGFVLAIACANLANLQLARATAGARELAIRTALGASRWRLIFEQLQECLLVSLLGGGVGLLVAIWVNRLLQNAISIDGVAGLDFPIHGSVLAITIVLSLLTGVVFGIFPAWLASRVDVTRALKSQSRGSTASRGHHRLRQGLIVIEVTLALVLLGGAATMRRGLARFLEHDAGWDTTRILTATLPLPETRFDTSAKRIELFRRLEARLTALPGVEHAALATSVPIFELGADRPILVEGQSAANLAQLPLGGHVMVSSDYFATVGIRLIDGRLFPLDIKAESPPVVVVNQRLARQLWPGRSAVGQRLGSIDSGQTFWYEVIGVVSDVNTAASIGEPPTLLQVYKPLVQEPWSWVYLVIRSAAPESLQAILPKAVAEVDPDLPATEVGTVRQLVDRNQHNLVVVSRLLTGFALLGLVLAAVGLYGVISNVVAQRTGEFGIRLALGAQRRDVLNLVLAHGLVLTTIGIVAGLAGAYGLGRFLGALMPRLARPDPLALVLVVLILGFVAFLACLIPAQRATRADPLSALRNE